MDGVDFLVVVRRMPAMTASVLTATRRAPRRPPPVTALKLLLGCLKVHILMDGVDFLVVPDGANVILRDLVDDSGKGHELIGIFVNLEDYTVGCAKGGEITRFSEP